MRPRAATVAILGMAAALGVGFGMPGPTHLRGERDRPISDGDRERIEAARAKRERKAAKRIARGRP